MAQLNYSNNNNHVQQQQHYGGYLPQQHQQPEKCSIAKREVVGEDVEDVVEILYYQCQICHEDVESNSLEKHVASHSPYSRSIHLEQKKALMSHNANNNPKSSSSPQWAPVSSVNNQPQLESQSQTTQVVLQNNQECELQKLSHYVGQLQPPRSNPNVQNIPNPTNVNFYTYRNSIPNPSPDQPPPPPGPGYTYQTSHSQMVYKYPNQYQYQQQQHQQQQQQLAYANQIQQQQLSQQYRGPHVDFRSSTSTVNYYPSHPPRPNYINPNQPSNSNNLGPPYGAPGPGPDPRQYSHFKPQPGQGPPIPVQVQQSSYNPSNYSSSINSTSQIQNPNPSYVTNSPSNYYNYNDANLTNVNNIEYNHPPKMVHPNYNHPSPMPPSNPHGYPPAQSPYIVRDHTGRRVQTQQYSGDPSKVGDFPQPPDSVNPRSIGNVHYGNPPSKVIDYNSPMLYAPAHQHPPSSSSPQSVTPNNNPDTFYYSNPAKGFDSNLSSGNNNAQAHPSSSPHPQSAPVNSNNERLLHSSSSSSNSAKVFNYNSSPGTNAQAQLQVQPHYPSPSQLQQPHSQSQYSAGAKNNPEKLYYSNNPAKGIDFNPSPVLTHAHYASSPHSVTTEEAGSPDISFNILEPDIKFQTYESVEALETISTPPLEQQAGGGNGQSQSQQSRNSNSNAQGSGRSVSKMSTTPSSAPPPDSSYPCEMCSEKFCSTVSLVSHVNTVHHVKLHECDQCGKKFEKRTGLLAHINRMHNANKKKERVMKKPKAKKNCHPYSNESVSGGDGGDTNNSPGGPYEVNSSALFQYEHVCFACQSVFSTGQELKVHGLNCVMIHGAS